MACAPEEVITSADLTGLKADISTIDDVVESSLDTTTTKSGKVVNTLLGQLKLLGFQVPIAYAGSIVFTTSDTTKTVEEAGVVYAPLPSALPFTTSGTFIGDDDARFFVVQGITANNLGQFSAVLEDFVADMTSRINPIAGTLIELKDYASGNGAGVLYFLELAGTGTDDGGSVINHDSLSFRYEQKFSNNIVTTKNFGSVCDWDGATGTDDTITAQACLDYCVENEIDMYQNDMSLITTLKYNRVVDGDASVVTVPGNAIVDSNNNDYYFTVETLNGGGFALNAPGTLFDTDLINNNATLPCVQLIRFRLRFEALNPADAVYVISPKFLRTCFDGCQWRKIKCLTSTTIITQSIYFIGGNNARRWNGTFFHSKNANFDLLVESKADLFEAGGDGFEIDFPVGSSIHGTIEGMVNFAIKYNGANEFNITYGYYEGNGRTVSGGLSIDGSSATGIDANEVITIANNYLSGDDTDFSKPQVKWGDSVLSTSQGNHSSTVMHEFATNSRPTIINDYARMALSTNDQKIITAITKAVNAQVTITDHGYFSGDSFATVAGDMTEINDQVLTIVSVIDSDNFTVNIDSTLFTTYTTGGLGYSTNHSIRSQFHVGIDLKAEGQYLYGGRAYGEFVGGSGGFLRLRSISNGVESSTGFDVDHQGNAGIGGFLSFIGTPQTLSGAGAVSLSTSITWIVTTSTDALTLGDGAEGQTKYIVMKTDGGAGTLTPTNLANGTTITFDDVGDSAELIFTNAAWHFIGGTATLA